MQDAGSFTQSSSSQAVAPWAAVRDQVLPVLLPCSAVLHAEHLVREEWINGLDIGYVLASLESNPADQPITLDDLARWRLSHQQLHACAIENLVLFSHEHALHGHNGAAFTMLRLAGGDRHNAARILLPELQSRLARHLGGTFYAAVPTRHTLLAFAAGDGRALARLRRQVEAEHDASTQPVSPRLFVVTLDGIAGDPQCAARCGG